MIRVKVLVPEYNSGEPTEVTISCDNYSVIDGCLVFTNKNEGNPIGVIKQFHSAKLIEDNEIKGLPAKRFG